MNKSSNQAPDDSYDIVIIGGGFYGAATCWWAAQYGYKVALFEQRDFGNGASSNSLKIVHGGIRYLQSLNLRRTLKSIKERNRLSIWFSHSIIPLKCVMPLEIFSLKNPLTVFAGFKIFSLLSRLQRDSNPSFNKTAVSFQATNTLVKYKKVFGFGYWCDPQAIHAERIPLEILSSANQMGADTFNYHKVEHTSNYHEQTHGYKNIVKVASENGNTYNIKTKLVIDCSSGWQKTDAEQRTKFVRAVNLILNRQHSGKACTINIGSRLLFACPWQDKLMIGTWYLYQRGPSTDLSISAEELESMLGEISQELKASITQEELINVHIGLLPLKSDPEDEEKLGNYLADESQCRAINPKNGLYRIEGIKFTTSVMDSHDALENILRQSQIKPSRTACRHPLLDCTITTPIEEYSGSLQEKFPWCGGKTIQRLISLYGAKATRVLEITSSHEGLRKKIPGLKHSLLAEIDYVVENESAHHLNDVLIRRIGAGSAGMPDNEIIIGVAKHMAALLLWTQQQLSNEIDLVKRSYPEVLLHRDC